MESLHGMYDGGHGAGLEDYWEAMWRIPYPPEVSFGIFQMPVLCGQIRTT